MKYQAGFLLLLACCAGCRSPYYADQGAALGGVTGALVGAAIGEDRGSPIGGAAIGGAVGALTGAAIGDSMDAEVARARAEVEQQIGRQLQGAVSMDDVIAMTRAGLSDEVIINQIRSHGVRGIPATNEVIILHQQGVSDRVIHAMQTTPPPQAVATVPAMPPAGGMVIVEERYYTPPPPPYWHPRYCRPPRAYHPYHRPGVHWRFSFGH